MNQTSYINSSTVDVTNSINSEEFYKLLDDIELDINCVCLNLRPIEERINKIIILKQILNEYFNDRINDIQQIYHDKLNKYKDKKGVGFAMDKLYEYDELNNKFNDALTVLPDYYHDELLLIRDQKGTNKTLEYINQMKTIINSLPIRYKSKWDYIISKYKNPDNNIFKDSLFDIKNILWECLNGYYNGSIYLPEESRGLLDISPLLDTFYKFKYSPDEYLLTRNNYETKITSQDFQLLKSKLEILNASLNELPLRYKFYKWDASKYCINLHFNIIKQQNELLNGYFNDRINDIPENYHVELLELRDKEGAGLALDKLYEYDKLNNQFNEDLNCLPIKYHQNYRIKRDKYGTEAIIENIQKAKNMFDQFNNSLNGFEWNYEMINIYNQFKQDHLNKQNLFDDLEQKRRRVIQDL
jgi:hypothetical protein